METAISFKVPYGNKSERIMISSSFVGESHFQVLVSGDKGKFFIDYISYKERKNKLLSFDEMIEIFNEHIIDALNADIFHQASDIETYYGVTAKRAKKMYEEFTTAGKHFAETFNSSITDICLVLGRDWK